MHLRLHRKPGRRPTAGVHAARGRERAAERLTALTGKTDAELFVKMYGVNLNYALGDAGAAVRAGQELRPDMYKTPERRGRYHTDMARAWWQWGKPEETAYALLAASQGGASEVRDRPKIRQIATDLTTMHPRVSGVRELATALT
ncbi:hypothetical protein GCM10018952_44220 [Streptosporangium vulgare]